MLRQFVGALLVLLVFGNGLLGADYKGRLEGIDVDRNTLTVRIDGKDYTFRVAPDARFYDLFGKEIGGGLFGAKRFLKPGQAIVITVDDRDIAIRVKVER